MVRPVQYSESDIRRAIQALGVEGSPVNPSRVRLRLGGGGVARIKSLVDEHLQQIDNASSALAMPEQLTAEFRRAVAQAADNLLRLAQKSNAHAADAPSGEESLTLRSRNKELESQLSTANALSEQYRTETERQARELVAAQANSAQLAQQREDLRAAIRNAESDLRAHQKVIETFEIGQKRDRDELRDLHKRVEGLVAELAETRASGRRR